MSTGSPAPSPRDARLVYAAAVLRSFLAGLVAVLLAVYLGRLGYGAAQLGLVITAALAGNAASTLLVSLVGDRLGRRRTLALLTLLTAVAALAFAAAPPLGVLVAAATVGAMSPSGQDRGAFLAIEQAILPQVVATQRRTTAFGLYHFQASLASAAGALATGGVALLQQWGGMDQLQAYRLTFLVVAAVSLAGLGLYARLSPAVELPVAAGPRPRPLVGLRHRRRVAGLAALFSVDALGGGFITQSFVAYWFASRFDLHLASLGALFFVATLLSAMSQLAAVRLARRIGLLNTMVFTHLPANVLLMLVAAAPTAPVAVALYLVRQSVANMDVPTRQAYIVGVVDPDERVAATALTMVARNVVQAVSPVVAGLAAEAALGAPFVVAGATKAAYDLALFVAFRKVRPPEEAAARGGAGAARDAG